MGDLFDITHELGNLDEYDSTVVDGGDLSAHVDAALAGTSYGLKCVIDDTTDIYGRMSQSWPGSNELRYRFYFDRNTFSGSNYNYVTLLHGNFSGSWWCRARLRQVGAGVQLHLYNSHDGGEDVHIVDPITAGEHYLEIHIERAATDVSADGRVRWWLDGALEKTWENVDNYDRCAALTSLDVGAIAPAAGVSGTVYLDEFKANDDGSEIGAAVAAVKDGIKAMAMGMRLVGM